MKLLELVLVVAGALLSGQLFVKALDTVVARQFPAEEKPPKPPLVLPPPVMPTAAEIEEDAAFEALAGTRVARELLTDWSRTATLGSIQQEVAAAVPAEDVHRGTEPPWLDRLRTFVKISGISLSRAHNIAILNYEDSSLRLREGDLVLGILKVTRIERDRIELAHPAYRRFWLYRVRPASLPQHTMLTQAPPDWIR